MVTGDFEDNYRYSCRLARTENEITARAYEKGRSGIGRSPFVRLSKSYHILIPRGATASQLTSFGLLSAALRRISPESIFASRPLPTDFDLTPKVRRSRSDLPNVYEGVALFWKLQLTNIGLKISRSTVQKHVDVLKSSVGLAHQGPRKGGHWTWQ